MGFHTWRFTRTSKRCGAFAFFSLVAAKQRPEKTTTRICVPKRAEQSGHSIEIDYGLESRRLRSALEGQPKICRFTGMFTWQLDT